MTQQVEAVYENGVLRPLQPLHLKESARVRVIACAEDLNVHVALPRNCLDEAHKLFRDHQINIRTRDERFTGTAISAAFLGELCGQQPEAVAAILEHDSGILCAPKRGVNTLVLVHRQQLLDQWRERLGVFLDHS